MYFASHARKAKYISYTQGGIKQKASQLSASNSYLGGKHENERLDAP